MPRNFHLHGTIPHGTLLQKMSRAHLLLNTSSQEGGANAICEAISLGLPVIASDIPGNTGMLGRGYAGYFPQGNPAALARLIEQTQNDPARYQQLRSQLATRAPLFHPELEAGHWHRLIKKIL